VIAGHQLAKAGFRLASLLNGIWVQPVSPNDVTRAANSAPAQLPSSMTDSGAIVGNRRSRIYAWPGCGSYDTMAPQNRVVFPSRDAAEQAGYRAAYKLSLVMVSPWPKFQSFCGRHIGREG
jgi:Metal binding domain of Ada